ncbi:MAG: hypothetical protein IT379_42655 [Deltaproteobacteria bacterium]|nr:hypothetical protein [Deltaproteobacteria bacterium]
MIRRSRSCSTLASVSRALPRHLPAVTLVGLLAVLAVGCTPEIGDDCSTSVDCSANGDRICDTAQPEGYCTVRGCERGTCPEEAICVEFRPNVDRLADRWCLYACESDDDCRDGYACLSADGDLSRVLDDRDSSRYCGVP